MEGSKVKILLNFILCKEYIFKNSKIATVRNKISIFKTSIKGKKTWMNSKKGKKIGGKGHNL